MHAARLCWDTLESFVDVFSSVLVLWRFSGEDAKASGDDGAAARRERIADMGISVSVSPPSSMPASITVIHRNDQERSVQVAAL